MPRKQKTKLKTLGRDQKGRYFRNLGWLRNEVTGAIRQKKFYLGHDEDEAKFANSRLEALWACIERVHERDQAIDSLFDAAGGRKEIQVEVSGNVLRLKKTSGGSVASAVVPDRCIWSPLTLEIAEAIRNGEPVARISDENIPGYRSPLSRIELDVWLSKLREDFHVIHIELENQELGTKLNKRLERTGLELKEKSQKLLALPKTSQRLHHAMEAYKLESQKEKVNADGSPSEWAKAKARQISFVQDHTQDLDLSVLGGPSIDTILATLRGRPFTKKGEHCKKRYAENCIKEFRVFLEWMSECEGYNWNWPPGYGLETNADISFRAPTQPIRLDY